MNSNFKKKLSAFAAMLALVSISSTTIATADTATFSTSNILGKTSNAEVAIQKNKMDINVNGGRSAVAQVDMKNFNVGKNQHVNYGFSNLSQTMINRVLGGSESKILGKITNSSIGGNGYAETGKVVLINPAGVVFDKGSTVDLNSLTVSTFDLKGAKNLQGMTEKQLKSYQNTLNTKFAAPILTDNTESVTKAFEFDSKAVDEFKAAGIDMDSLSGNTKITFDGTHFNKFEDQTNSKIAGYNTNKNVNVVADNIDYKDSMIKVGDNATYLYKANGETHTKSYSNVRLITADGVTFNYAASGAATSYDAKAGDKNVTRKVTMNNSGLNGKTAIDANDIRISTNANTNDSNIDIKNTVIRGRKLVNGENNNIQIIAAGDTNVENTRFDTVNTKYTVPDDKKLHDTTDKVGGQVYIRGENNLNIKDSVIKTAGTSKELTSAGKPSNSANVNLIAGKGTANTDNVKVVASGDIYVRSNKDTVNINNTLLRAKNTVGDNPQAKNIEIKAPVNVNVNDSVAEATGNINIISATGNGVTSGKINITSTQKDGVNQTLIKAGKDLSIEGKNSTIDNTSLQYKNLSLYNNNTTGISNVTVKNGTTFTKLTPDSQHIIKDINLETNGDFTMDNATMQTSKVNYQIAKDDNTAKGLSYTVSGTPSTANNVTVTSTKGNVNVVNGSDINVKNDINMTAIKGQYTQTSSDLKAGNDVNIVADKDVEVTSGINRHPDMEGGIFIYEGISAGKDVNITSKNGGYNQGSADINAKNDVNITAKNDVNARYSYIDADKDININAGKNVNMGNINDEYTSYVYTDAGNDANITAGEQINVYSSYIDAKTGNATLTANGEGNKGNINISNSKIKAGKDADTYASKGGDINITSKAGSYIQNNSDISGKDNVNITADKSVNMVNNSSVYSKHDTTIKSNNGSIGQIDSRITSFEDDINLEAKGNIETSGSTIGTFGNVNITSTNGSYKQGEASATTIDTDTQKEALHKFGKSSISAGSVNIDAQKDVKILNRSTIDSQFGSININANEGKYTQSVSKLTSAQDVNVRAKQDLTIDQNGKVTQRLTDTRNRAEVCIDAKEDVNLTSQEGNYKQIKQSINADNINIEATKGSINIADTAFNKAGNDINVKSSDTIKFGLEKDKSANIDDSTGFLAGNNIKFQSTNGDIVAEKTEMAQYSLGHEGAHATGPYADINYGGRLEFNAKGDNVFTSKNSLKSVNVDYIAGGSNKFDTQDDIQFVNSSLQGQQNTINSGDDIVLNNLKADSAKTQINAEGFITEENITGEDLNATGGSFPQSVKVNKPCDPVPTVDPKYDKLSNNN